MSGRNLAVTLALAALGIPHVSPVFAQMIPGENGAGRPVAGQTRFFHTDHVGNVVVVTDDKGRETARLTQTPYGVLNLQASSGTDDFRSKFAGKERDQRTKGSGPGANYDAPSTDLSAYPARYYSPGLGRFISPDPAMQSTNPYSYASGNPVSMTDPTGLATVPAAVLSNESFLSSASTSASFASEGAEIGTASAIETSIVSAEASAAEAGVAAGPLDLALISAFVLANVAIFSGSSPTLPAVPALPAGSDGSFSAAVVPGTWAAAGSSRVSQAMNLLRAPYSMPVKSKPTVAGALPGPAAFPDVPNVPANLMGTGGAGRTGQCPPVTGTSFVAGTPVLTPTGPVNVEDLRVGNRVLGLDENAGEVTRLFTRVASDVVTLQLGGLQGLLVTTREHPYWVDGRGWVKAKSLAPGDRLRTGSGGTVPVLTVELSTEAARVFNIEVEPSHVFQVGLDGIIAHNIHLECISSRVHYLGSAPPGVNVPIINFFIEAHEYVIQYSGVSTGSYAAISYNDFANIMTSIPYYYSASLNPYGAATHSALLPNWAGIGGTGATGYDRGHILARQNGGHGGIGNIFAQNNYINRGHRLPQGILVDPLLSTFAGQLDTNGMAINEIPTFDLWRGFEDDVNWSVSINPNTTYQFFVWMFY